MSLERLTDSERADWLQLSLSENVGPAAFALLLDRFGSAAGALDALPELAGQGGLSRKIRICPRAEADRQLDQAHTNGAEFIGLCEPKYPKHLAHIHDPPPLICAKGRFELLEKPALGVVGARNASAAGAKLARTIAHDMGNEGFVIVSGLARGIDTAAHEAALPSGTIAVLAGGLDIIYPPENETLYREIADLGIILTERAFATKPRARDFPRRNRLISGLSMGVVIVEAAARSGALITARYALEQGREVFAVPGSPLDPRAAGPNNLLKQGASLTTGAPDIIEQLGPILDSPKTRKANVPPPAAAQKPRPMAASTAIPGDARSAVLDALSVSPVGIDDLVRNLHLSVSEIRTILVELELAGRLLRHIDHTVSRIET